MVSKLFFVLKTSLISIFLKFHYLGLTYSGFNHLPASFISALTVILDSPAMVFQPSVDRQRSRDSAAGGGNGVGSAGGSDGGFWSNAPSSAGARTGI